MRQWNTQRLRQIAGGLMICAAITEALLFRGAEARDRLAFPLASLGLGVVLLLRRGDELQALERVLMGIFAAGMLVATVRGPTRSWLVHPTVEQAIASMILAGLLLLVPLAFQTGKSWRGVYIAGAVIFALGVVQLLRSTWVGT